MATYTSNYGWTKPSGSDNVDISVLNDNLDDQDSTIHDAFLNMAPPFSESATYAVDDIVLYGTGLYKCHTAVVTPGSWTGSTNWQVYKLSEGGSGGGGTSNYNDLTNKPSINGVELSGNKTASDLWLASTTDLANKADKTATASGETLALVPTSEGRALLHTAYGMSTQSGTPTPSSPVDIESAKADFRCVGKNLNVYPYKDTTKTSNNVTFTDNGDGTVTVSTTSAGASGNVTFTCHTRTPEDVNDLIIKNGKYILTGCPSGGSDSKYRITTGCVKNGGFLSLGIDYGEGVVVTADGDDYSPNGVNIQITIDIRNGCVLTTPITFKPMLRLADVTDSTYEPYTKHDTTTDLTLRAIEVTSSDAYNLVRDGKYYIADTLDYSEDNGFVVTRRVGHIVPTTTMTWGKATSTNSYYITVSNTSLAVRNVKSNRFVGAIWSDTVPTGDVVFLHNAQHIIYFRNDAITSVDDWKTWLGNNALYADYILDAPITQTITTAQALALLGLKTYDESTTISSQAEPSCTIAVEYAKERLGALALTAYNTAKGNDLRITALEG